MSKFPFYALIRNGYSPKGFLGIGDGTMNWDAAREDLGVPFDVQVSSDLYWTGKQDFYHLEKDFGPLRPPYPAMWMEWRVPSVPLINGQPRPESRFAGRRMAALVTESPEFTSAEIRDQITQQRKGGNPEFYSTVRRIPDRGVGVTIIQFIEGDSGNPECIPLPVSILLDVETGRYVPGSKLDLPAKSWTAEYLDGSDGRIKLIRAIDQNVPLLALTLINCRNVSVADGGQAFARTTREKRLGVPAVRFKTIVLPGIQRGTSSRVRSMNSDVMAMHRVRGHFKTYTPDAPLMGKHVGTYWWGWQVRGNKDNGVVVSDYKLGAAS